MGVKAKIISMNWEKITVYLTITIAFLALTSQLFTIKDNITKITERIAKLEVQFGHEDRLKKIEEKLK